MTALGTTRTVLLALLLGPVIALTLLTAIHNTLLAPQPQPQPQGAAQPAESLEDTVAAQSTVAVASPAPDPAPGPVARPARIKVPAIGVDADVVPLGLHDDGTMEVPDTGLAGWYRPGPRPGAPGPAVIAAHVDSRRGPDVFFRLHELRPGDRITVSDARGARHRFVVVSSEQAPKDELPVERIWSDDGDVALRLITCGGTFDHGTGHYRDNVIVYAEAG